MLIAAILFSENVAKTKTLRRTSRFALSNTDVTCFALTAYHRELGRTNRISRVNAPRVTNDIGLHKYSVPFASAPATRE